MRVLRVALFQLDLVLFLGGMRCIFGASDSFRPTCMLAFDFVFSLVADLSVMLKRCYICS